MYFFLGVSAIIVILVCLGIGLLDLLVSILKRNIKRRLDNAFTEIIFFIYTNRSIQCRRRLCRNSAYSGTNSKHTPPYDYGGIFRPYHCCGNDPGSYIHKFFNICRYAYRRYRRCVALLARLYHSVICHMLYTRIFYYKYRTVGGVQTVLSALRPAVVALITSAGTSILMLALFQTDIFSASLKDIRFVELGIFLVALFLLRKFKTNAITIILGSGVVGTLIYMLLGMV